MQCKNNPSMYKHLVGEGKADAGKGKKARSRSRTRSFDPYDEVLAEQTRMDLLEAAGKGEVYVKTPTGKRFTLEVEATDTLADVQRRIRLAEQVPVSSKVSLVREVYDDGSSLSSQKLLGETFYMLPDYAIPRTP